MSRIPRLGWAILALALALPVTLVAQGGLIADSSSTRYTIPGELVDHLPLDRAVDALIFQPGVTTTNDGEVSIRGGKPGDATLYLDGIPVLSAFRSTPFFSLTRARSLESGNGVSPNLVGSLDIETGPMPARLGNAQSGAISIRTREAVPGLAGGLSYETDEPFGSGASDGLNRVEGSLSAALGPRLSFMAGGVVQGQRSIESGFDAGAAPIFVAAGTDTTVAVPSSPGDPLSDTTLVNVQDYAVSRGDCDQIAASVNQEIAENYGLPCRGSQTPYSPVSTYQLLGKLSYDLAAGSHLSLLGLAGQQQNRNFEYGTLYNPAGVTGNRASSGLIGLVWQHSFNQASGRPLSLAATLSSQWDRQRQGPLTLEEVQSTADLTGGFLVRPLDLLYDFDNFPVDDELVRNYRSNLPGSRRSPYDLESPNQYALVDQYRNNPYGLYNRDPIARVIFPERGGPVGRLTLYRERRTVATADLGWQLGRSNQLQLGGELTRYAIDNYSHLLESQLSSDVYRENPVRAALYIQDQVRLGTASITGGLRYEWYKTGARRPADFPRISTHPAYDPADPDAFLTSDTFFPEDESHGRLSPHLQASVAVSPRTTFRGGVAQQAQMPDLTFLLLGINTDIGISGDQQVFGQDLDFERTDIYELGARHAFAADFVVDLAVYSKSIRSDVRAELVSRLDPSTSVNRNLLVLTNGGTGRTRGVDLRLERSWGPMVSGWVGYSYQDAKLDLASGSVGAGTVLVPQTASRPHSLTGGVAIQVPAEWRPGSTVGAILRNAGVFTTFRFASGTAYTSCPGDLTTLSPDLCATVISEPINGERLPAFKQLDLRLTKSFGPDRRLTGYVDARNLLNFENVLAVFASNGETGNPNEQEINWLADSADLASEAAASGALRGDGAIDLGEGQVDPRAGCSGWLDQSGTPAAPNCVYLIRAEERFGNGDHLFDPAEQRRASDALYRAVRGRQELTGPGRRVRLGLSASF